MFATNKKKIRFLDPEEAVRIEQILRSMAIDNTYNTSATYSANSELYPDNLIPFVDKHMKYIGTHPSIDPWHYISNLRLMTRVR
jgi:hypothetical protein